VEGAEDLLQILVGEHNPGCEYDHPGPLRAGTLRYLVIGPLQHTSDLAGRYMRLASRQTATSPRPRTLINPPSRPPSGPAILCDQTSLTARLLGLGSEWNKRDLAHRTNVLGESKGCLRCDEGEPVTVARAHSGSMVLARYLSPGGSGLSSWWQLPRDHLATLGKVPWTIRL
jgi:hypothetical protein